MADVRLFLWDISVAVGIFGFGKLGLRLLKITRPPLAVTGCFGISLWIALGGFLNLLHLLRPVCLLRPGWHRHGTRTLRARSSTQRSSRRETQRNAPTPTQPPRKAARRSCHPHHRHNDARCHAAAHLVFRRHAGLHRPLGVKAAQTHSIQPDPLLRAARPGRRRRPATSSTPSCTPPATSARWTSSTPPSASASTPSASGPLAARWKIPPTRHRLRPLPAFLSLRSSRSTSPSSISPPPAFFAAHSFSSPTSLPTSASAPGRILALGTILGGLLTTKTPNVIFVVPFLFFVVVLHRLFRSRYQVMLPVILSLLVAVATFIPWSIANKTNAGTYLLSSAGPWHPHQRVPLHPHTRPDRHLATDGSPSSHPT